MWKGPEEGVLIEVRDVDGVTLEDIMVGSHDAGAMTNSADIHQFGSANASRMTYDGVYVFGMYQKSPFRKGFLFTESHRKRCGHHAARPGEPPFRGLRAGNRAGELQL